MASPVNFECSVKSCPFKAEGTFIQCYADGCNNVTHLECCDFLVLRKNGVDHFSDDPNLQGAVVCCKRHCDAAKRKAAALSVPSENRNIPWNKDGPMGHDDPTTSESTVLDWWTTGQNHADFCNGTGGKTKIQRMLKLSEIIKEKGVVKERKPHDILNKIQSFERQFKVASDFANNTGEGIKETDGVATFEELVKKRFKHYFLLLPIMADRSNTKPAASSDAVCDEKNDSDDFSSVDSSKEESLIDTSKEECPEDVKDAAASPNNNTGDVQVDQGGENAKVASRKSVDLTSKKTKKARVAKAQKKSFEEMFLSIQERQLSLEEGKGKMEMQKMSIENRVSLMKQVKSLQKEDFSKKEILGMFPEAKGTFDSDDEEEKHSV